MQNVEIKYGENPNGLDDKEMSILCALCRDTAINGVSTVTFKEITYTVSDVPSNEEMIMYREATRTYKGMIWILRKCIRRYERYIEEGGTTYECETAVATFKYCLEKIQEEYDEFRREQGKIVVDE